MQTETMTDEQRASYVRAKIDRAREMAAELGGIADQGAELLRQHGELMAKADDLIAKTQMIHAEIRSLANKEAA